MNVPDKRALALTYTASGSEYFRIWIVNILLIVVTLGFYLPFAKARRLRYFYANTLVDQQALAFHGDAWKMLRGYVLMLVLFGGYGLSGHFSAWAAFGMFVLLACAWPALWRSSLRFRLHNTSWRGLRFGFEGSAGDAYRAMLPLFVPGLLFLAVNAWFMGGVDKADQAAVKAALGGQAPWMLLGLALLLLLFPLCLGLIKRYQHQGYRYSGQRGVFSASTGAFYKLCAKAGGLTLLVIAAFGLLIAVSMPLLAASIKGAHMAGAIAIAAATLAIYLALLSLLGSYFTARLQDLSWNATTSQALTFQSRLRARSLAKLNLKNLALVLITLGLYRPFAVVNTMALRLAAMHVELAGDIETWAAGRALSTDATSGEMAGDFFGIDVGL